ncbi:hypothetical protein Plim_0855 [Planctopirus limnophila DSM 3776]|uniref:Uncharacterized protein n=1 Tax=Planctopirus limnophila (strain ATCC 43296 / DSM 3776 / IFAM 1008 / Mu 290) TaxID=521674 RepID=D5SSF1_PLAL2|nr:hypothetical protein [Planctopirus limnophila]ADG66699.1 hypothetical protein Plim_0855 [Planctopirus limnophila DSM 3776]
MAFFSGLYAQSRLRIITSAVILALMALPCAAIGLWWATPSPAVVDQEDSSTGIDALLGSLERGDPPQALVPVPRSNPNAGKLESSDAAHVTVALHSVHENDRTETIEPASFNSSATMPVSQQAVWFAGEIEPIETDPQPPMAFSPDRSAETSPTKSWVEVVPYSQSAAPVNLAP